uniref:PEP/pyruvate-binding domain-containing protein n=1 Tax=Parabacteroides goldsteinii TaxID=328812 RepID=UPI00256F3522
MKNMVISYSFGIIDFLHFGHIRLFEDARKFSNRHILGLISDAAFYSWHGTLVSSYEERLAVLQGVKYIDEIRLQNSFDPLPNLQLIHREFPEAKIVLYIGNDRNFVPCENYLKEIGGEVKVIDYYEKLSPQNILDCLTTKAARVKQYSSNLISTKANTLLALKPVLSKGKIEDIYVLTVNEYVNDFIAAFQNIKEKFQGDYIVVRSSSVAEDCFESSNAGHFESVLGINSSDMVEVKKAIGEVVRSYDQSTDFYKDEQILIQRQTMNVACSGVIFTRDVDSNLPYYLINYDDGGSTDSVTSGSGGNTIWILRKKAKNNPPNKWKKLLSVVAELESLLNKMILDIEFAVTSDDEVVIFQVRPLAANYKFQVKQNDEQFYRCYKKELLAYNNIKNYQTSVPMLLSDMAFWNPSEIIGVNPHNLDYSLYREIITKHAWNEGLLPLGYKRVPDDLMFRIGNKPYISIDYSFLALTPEALEENLRNKLCHYYEKQLLKDTTSHDKIEFEIVFSCLDFSTDRRLK